MATNTEHYDLIKPDESDFYNIDDHNTNMDTIDGVMNQKLNQSGDGSNVTIAFTQASARTNLSTGEKLSASLGKIMRWFADLGALAFKSKVADADLEQQYMKVDDAAYATFSAVPRRVGQYRVADNPADSPNQNYKSWSADVTKSGGNIYYMTAIGSGPTDTSGNSKMAKYMIQSTNAASPAWLATSGQSSDVVYNWKIIAISPSDTRTWGASRGGIGYGTAPHICNTGGTDLSTTIKTDVTTSWVACGGSVLFWSFKFTVTKLASSTTTMNLRLPFSTTQGGVVGGLYNWNVNVTGAVNPIIKDIWFDPVKPGSGSRVNFMATNASTGATLSSVPINTLLANVGDSVTFEGNLTSMLNQ